jgi:hypothetical protein
VEAKLSTTDQRSLARRYWSTHKDFLTSIADDEVMSEHGLTDWATASPAQNEQRQLNRTAAKTKCVLEQTALLKASRAVVDYVGNTEMPNWSDGNKESVESRAIEFRHKLTQHLGQRAQHPTTAVEHRGSRVAGPQERPPMCTTPQSEGKCISSNGGHSEGVFLLRGRQPLRFRRLVG